MKGPNKNLKPQKKVHYLPQEDFTLEKQRFLIINIHFLTKLCKKAKNKFKNKKSLFASFIFLGLWSVFLLQKKSWNFNAILPANKL